MIVASSCMFRILTIDTVSSGIAVWHPAHDSTRQAFLGASRLMHD